MDGALARRVWGELEENVTQITTQKVLYTKEGVGTGKIRGIIKVWGVLRLDVGSVGCLERIRR